MAREPGSERARGGDAASGVVHGAWPVASVPVQRRIVALPPLCWLRLPLPRAARRCGPGCATDAVIGPFIAFFRDHGKWALLMLAAISLYRLPDFLLGPMANPFYSDLGMDKDVVGGVRGSIGLAATIVGIAAAGISSVRFGTLPTLVAGAVLGPGSNLAFSYLALHGADPGVFAGVMAIDNFCNGFVGVALIAYMSQLTHAGYTATQYALLSSFYALPGKFLKGLTGVAVEHLEQGRTLLEAYALFFLGTALVGIPAVLLCLWLAMRTPVRKAAAAVT